MADALVSGILENLLTGLGSRAAQEIGSVLGVKEDLKRLKDTVSTIQVVLEDAEERQLNNPKLRLWLSRIKNASYDATDIVDDFEIEALRQNLRIQHHGNTTKKVLRFAFSLSSSAFHFKMSRRIKQVTQKFEEIENDRNKFQLTEKPAVDVRVMGAERGQTHSFVDKFQVFGREDNKHEIVKLLLDMEGLDNLSMVAIQGMGGLGKTTLAQLVYNDERLDTYFELKMWVCVSLQFDVKLITAQILESATHNGRSKLEMGRSKSGQFGMGQSQFRDLEMDQLQSQLREKLQGKRFLLVLDDVWNEDAEKWDNMKMLLTGGAKGSKVLATTRSKKVASIMGAAAATTYHLKGLSDDDCWDLFKERAFARGQEEAHPNLVVIGKEIVKKCGGVPLAAKSLGSLMRFKTNEHEWKSVKENEIWRLHQNENGILPALRLSYNHLPFYLKQCFAYCFFLSKGQEILKKVLIQVWISQGFIVYPSGDYQYLWNIGEEFVNELVLRSFFDFTDDDQDQLKMHDLIIDLARDVAGKECINWKRATNVPSPKEVRHLSCNYTDEYIPCDELGSMRAFSNVRTLRFAVESLVDDFFLNFRCLRVLEFNLENESCPSSIGKLKHLRHLIIHSDYIETLPKSITKLQSLQFLYTYCPKLRELPMDIEKMVNLRYLYVDPDAPLSHMPRGLKSLTSLRELRLFVVGKGTGCKLSDLHGLIHLGGFLQIRNLQNVSSAIDSAEANLREKQLESLMLEWNEEDSGGHVISGDEAHVAVLETLEPHPNIQQLDINGYRGGRFPRWLMEPLFPKMVRIDLRICMKCQRLPPFWKLPSLKYMGLFDMDALQCMENSVKRGGQQVWFPSLVELGLCGVPNLESFTPRAADNGIQQEEEAEENLLSVLSFPSLEILILFDCSEKLVRSLLILGKDNPSSSPPNSSLAKLKHLIIHRCHDLESLPEGALQSSTSLEKLELMDCPKLVSLPECIQNAAAKLQTLKITNCEGLMYLPDWMGNLKSLGDLSICRCPNLVIDSNSLSGGGMEFLASLELVKFKQLPKLVSLPECIQNAGAKLQTLTIKSCEGLMGLPDWMGNLKSLRDLSIYDCPLLQLLPDALQQLTALEALSILGCTGLTSWPNWLGSLTSLRLIEISCSSNLPSLPQQLRNLTALQSLGIVDSDILPSLPEWMVNLTSLQRLGIFDCDHLTSRCQKDTGEDWPKISHIPNIEIDGVTIQDK